MACRFKGCFVRIRFSAQVRKVQEALCLFCLSFEITQARCVIGTAFIRPGEYPPFSFKAFALFKLKPMSVRRRGSDLFAPNA